jgi:hypothetical protein
MLKKSSRRYGHLREEILFEFYRFLAYGKRLKPALCSFRSRFFFRLTAQYHLVFAVVNDNGVAIGE